MSGDFEVQRDLSVAELFGPLDGESFVGEAALRNALIPHFNAHLREFPPHYGVLDAIRWAMRQSWLTVRGPMITVSLPALAEADPPPIAALA